MIAVGIWEVFFAMLFLNECSLGNGWAVAVELVPTVARF